MQGMIPPQDFARIMALPIDARRDLLEYLGSIPVAAGDVERLLRALAPKPGAVSKLPADQAA